MRAVRITRTGGPEVLELADIPTPAVGSGQALVRHHAIGLNFIDIYRRTGVYPVTFPAILGSEAAGVVEAVGEGVTKVRVGERVTYAMLPGAYAEANVVPAERLVSLPDSISFETAAAATLKGLTAEFLTQRIWPLAAGDTVLVHAAAGGVGLLLIQWLHHMGVQVIGVVGTEEKGELARRQGCSETIIRGQGGDLADQVRALTSGQGVKIAYDSVGAATFEASLRSLQRRGLLVSFGNASGPAPAVAPLRLVQGGSLYLTRPTLADYVVGEELDTAAKALFDVIRSGVVKVEIGQTWPLEQVRKAHEALEAGRTIGATVLTL